MNNQDFKGGSESIFQGIISCIHMERHSKITEEDIW